MCFWCWRADPDAIDTADFARDVRELQKAGALRAGMEYFADASVSADSGGGARRRKLECSRTAAVWSSPAHEGAMRYLSSLRYRVERSRPRIFAASDLLPPTTSITLVM